MLRNLEEREFDRYVEFAYRLALDMTKSGYPTYADGIKTKEDFVSRSREAFSREGEGILLFERGGKTAGWIHYYHLPEDRYLDTNSFCVAEGMGEALAEFMGFARERFPGSELYLGFPKENREAVTALEALGFDRIEESYNDVVDFAHYTPQPENADLIPITRDNFRLFAELHAQHEADMYWTSQRLLNALDTWRIFALVRKGEAAGAIYSRLYEDVELSEIFGVDFPEGVYDGEVYRALLTAALNGEKSRGAKHMVFFNDAQAQADALACGFRCVGEYVCFKTEV